MCRRLRRGGWRGSGAGSGTAGRREARVCRRTRSRRGRMCRRGRRRRTGRRRRRGRRGLVAVQIRVQVVCLVGHGSDTERERAKILVIRRMSSASYASASGARRVLTGAEAYAFAVHAAFVAYARDVHFGAPAPAPARRSSENAQRTLGALAERMRDAGSSRTRFPEKTLRRLSDCMQRVAMGRDPVHTQPGLRRTCGAFFGTLNDPATVRRLRESRRIEEIIMLFASTASALLHKAHASDAERRAELDAQLAALLGMLQECVRGLGASRELVETLEEYAAPAASPAPPPPPPPRAADFPLVRAAAGAFGVDDAQLQRDTGALDPLGALAAAAADCRRQLAQIAAGVPPADEFASADAYAAWRAAELGALTAQLADLCRRAPQLVHTPRDAPPTRLPACAPACFRLVVEQCVDADLARTPGGGAGGGEAGVLSGVHAALLDECAAQWRVSPAAAAAAHLHVIRARFDRAQVPLACLADAVHRAARADAPCTRSDAALLTSTLGGALDALCRALYPHCERILDADPALVRSLVHAADACAALLAPDALAPRAAVLTDALRTGATHAYAAHAAAAASAPAALDVLTALLDWVDAHAARLAAAYPPTPALAPAATVVDTLAALLAHDTAAMQRALHAECVHATDAAVLGDALALLPRVRALAERAPGALDPGALFAPIVRHWLALAETRAEEWVRAAIRADSFAPDATHVYSSSVRDLHDALHQPAQALGALAWPAGAERTGFYTRLARMAAHVVGTYARALEALFMAELVPREPSAPPPSEGRAWVERARATLGDRRAGPSAPPPPVHVAPASCIKLNDIEGARIVLDALYHELDADAVAAAAPPARASDGTPQFAFAVKLVQAELALGAVPAADTFVTLSDVRGSRLAKTRTIVDSPTPRWDEVFDLGTDEPMWLSATVWVRDRAAPLLLGRAPLLLDPALFGDTATHETWLELSNGAGRLHVRLSMESVHDDILFYFGRAFRALKRVESDMVRVLIDRMAAYMREILSRATLRTLVRGRLNIDRALGNVRALYASAIERANGTAALIPPVETRGGGGGAALSDLEIEEAIAPLLDYFEDTLGTLKASLSEHEAQLVLVRIWKEVLHTLEALLVPPLAATPSDMPQLSDKEVDIVFKWLSFLRTYFNAYDPETGIAHGIPLDVLQGPKYRELLSYLLLHDQSTDALMIECVRGFQARLASAPEQRRSKSVLEQRSLGTIRAHKRAKAEDGEPALTHMAMKILRMRPGTADFLAQQLISMDSLKQALASGPGGLRRVSRRLEH